MIQTTSQPDFFQTEFTASSTKAIADAPIEKGGRGTGFGPHELLEAALATCINMAVRMSAAKLGIALNGVAVCVKLDRSLPHVTTFEYATEIRGALTTEERARLMHAADTCPVRQTLSKGLIFKSATALPIDTPSCTDA